MTVSVAHLCQVRWRSRRRRRASWRNRRNLLLCQTCHHINNTTNENWTFLSKKLSKEEIKKRSPASLLKSATHTHTFVYYVIIRSVYTTADPCWLLWYCKCRQSGFLEFFVEVWINFNLMKWAQSCDTDTVWSHTHTAAADSFICTSAGNKPWGINTGEHQQQTL